MGGPVVNSRVEYYQDSTGQWRWRVRAANGEIISESSESYRDRSDAVHGYQLTIQSQEG